jgi:hypothetical protein
VILENVLGLRFDGVTVAGRPVSAAAAEPVETAVPEPAAGRPSGPSADLHPARTSPLRVQAEKAGRH